MTFEEWKGDHNLQGYHAKQAWDVATRAERARIRQELEAEIGGLYADQTGRMSEAGFRDAVLAALDRICPEEP